MAKDPTGAQPETLETFDAAARKGGVKPAEVGLEANSETEPRPDDPRSKDRAATRILQAGVDNDPEEAGRIARARKDPRID